MSGKYDDIINLPHHVSEKHPQMSLHDRAAQFSPFAALTGYDDAVKETARLTDTMFELDEDEKSILDEKLRRSLENKDEISVTYFVKDNKKEGGSYNTVSGTIKKIDEYLRTLVLNSGEEIPIDNIYDIN